MRELYSTILRILRGESARDVLESPVGPDAKAYQVGYQIGQDEAAKAGFRSDTHSDSVKLMNRVMKDNGVYFSGPSLESFTHGFLHGWHDAVKKHEKCESQQLPKPDLSSNIAAENQILRIYRNRINDLTKSAEAPKGRVLDAQIIHHERKPNEATLPETEFIVVLGRDFYREPWFNEIHSPEGWSPLKYGDDDDALTVGKKIYIVATTMENLYKNKGYRVRFSITSARLNANKTISAAQRVTVNSLLDLAYKEIGNRIKAGASLQSALANVIVDPSLSSAFDTHEYERMLAYLRKNRLYHSPNNPFFKQGRTFGRLAAENENVLELLPVKSLDGVNKASRKKLADELGETLRTRDYIQRKMLDFVSRQNPQLWQRLLRFRMTKEAGGTDNIFAVQNFEEGFNEGYMLNIQRVIKAKMRI